MTPHRLKLPTLSAFGVAALLAVGALAAPAGAASPDRDGDRIPDRWERSHGMNPKRAADAHADFDRDGLANLAEYRLGGSLRDEDTDDDGHDDGDEVKDGTRSTSLTDADTDDDGVLDGDEDADRDGVANEDEDDARESCRLDDDDRDRDDVDDEDENELRLSAGDPDQDEDGVLDGDEDADRDGEANEDEDDDAADRCIDDPEEDEGDLFGAIASFDAASGILSVTSLGGFTVSAVVTDETEIELEEPEGFEGDFDDEGTVAHLTPGARVAELDLDDETGAFEEIEVYYQP